MPDIVAFGPCPLTRMDSQMPTRSLMGNHSDAGQGGFRGMSSRHFLKMIEDAGEVGFWSADLRKDKLDASIGLYRILGLDPATPFTFGFGLDMIHPEDRAVHGDQIAVLRTGQPISREFRIIRPDRTQRWIHHRAEVLLGPQGEPHQGLGVVFDVTARHDTQKAVEQRFDRYNALITATAAVVWIVSPDGEALEMPLWQTLTGQSHAAMQGQGWLDAIHPEDRERTAAAWRTAVSHVAPYNTDFRLLCADGVFRWFNSQGVPVLNRDGSIREWVGVCLAVPGQNRFGAPWAPDKPVDTGQGAAPMITPAQIRGARGMIGLSKDELARRSQVSVSTIMRLEDTAFGIRPRPETLQAVRRVLEQAGVEFTFEPGAKPGLREA